MSSLPVPDDRDSPPSAQARDRAPALDDVIASSRDHLKGLFPVPSARPRRRHAPAMATGGVLAVALAALLWADPAWRTENHASAVGERRTLALRDGSTVVLDSRTDVHIAWHLRSRRVALQQGRARFTVEPSWRPFTVDTDTARVRVVGTVFDVDRGAGYSDVNVLRGRVRVASATHPDTVEVLTPGQQVRVAAGAAADTPLVHTARDEAAGAWADGRLEFRSTALPDALAQLQRYRSAPLRWHGNALAPLRISGVFDAARTEQLIDLLPAILPVRVVRQPDGVVDVHPR